LCVSKRVIQNQTQMKVHLLTIGDEILIGQVVDTNSAWMAQQLNHIGAQVQGITSISDELDDIVNSLERLLPQTDVILMTGGLGPTRDDVTKKALAAFFDTGFVFSQETYDRILKLFERWGRTSTEAHRQQCFMPQNATLLFNKMGTAPGMWFEHHGKIVVSMPGVPYEMKYLMEHQVLPRLKDHFPAEPIAHRTILTVGEGESRIADRIADFEANLPQHIKLAYLPNIGQVRLRLTGKSPDMQLLDSELDARKKELEDLLPELVFGTERETLEEVIGRILQERGLTLATAESCTGGYVASRITSVAGSSAYFMGSVVAYSNAVKEKVLGVSPKTLEQHGAVSEQTVKEMVQGALQLLETDIAIAISGIAGPGGGTPEKPVGTIWLAVGDASEIRTQKLQIGKDRLRNIQYTTVVALNFIRQFVLKL